MDIVKKLLTDLIYIIVEYLPDRNRNRDKYRLKYLYEKIQDYDPLYYGNLPPLSFEHLLPFPTRKRYHNIMMKIRQKVNEYTRQYIKDYYIRGNKMEILKDLPFFVNCEKCKKIHCKDDYIIHSLFKNEMYIFKGYFHSKNYEHMN